MRKALRATNIENVKKVCDQGQKIYDEVILGHENCPVYYMESRIDECINILTDLDILIKVNIPVVFEEYLEYFKNEIPRLKSINSAIKFIVNDWGMLKYLHEIYPEEFICVGKGLSFTYGDCPWNEHIMEAEKPEYQEILKAHNMQNDDTISLLKEYNVDEIELSHLTILRRAYEKIKSHGFTVTVNKDFSIVSMSRACHYLRFMDKLDIKGKGCSEICSSPLVLKTSQYYDMSQTEHKSISERTDQLQPEMIFIHNMLLLEKQENNSKFDNIDCVITDDRVASKNVKMPLFF